MTGLRLLLVTDAVGGVWVYSLELARALGSHGVETVLAVIGPSATARQREDAVGITVIDTGLPLEWLDTNPAEIRAAGAKLAELAARIGADVVQTCSAALLADTDFGRPTVAVQHSCLASWWAAVKGTPLPSEFEWRCGLVEAGLQRADAVVAPSVAFAAETARFYDVPALAIHNGRRAVTMPDLPRADFVFTASRLWDKGKNAATLDAAAAISDVPFQAAGPLTGPNGAVVRLEHMRSLGEISHLRLSGLLAAHPVYASAALYEPFGLSVLEAAQAGCALVLSDIPTHRELWNGVAVFVPPRDAAAFAAAARRLFDHPVEREALGDHARGRAQRYTAEAMAAKMADLYAGMTVKNLIETPKQMAGAA